MPKRIIEWNASVFSVDWILRVVNGRRYRRTMPYQPHKALIWWCRIVGAGLTIMCVFALYSIFFLIE